ncbi:MAG: RecQ family ATP-dependent DNA helicase, partial [Sphingomonadales bacterium]
RYEVAAKDEPRKQLQAFIAGQAGRPGIVYAPTRATTDKVTEWLVAAGINARAYHAGLDASVRARNQHDFVKSEDMVMVATIAFGMGIDKPDVRFVAHIGLPKSIEAYYQETGRAGRDGDPAVAHLIWGGDDVSRIRQFITTGGASDAHKQAELKRLGALIGFLDAPGCRRQPLLAYFGDTLAEPCGNCDNCLNPPLVEDVTEAARKLLSAAYRTGQRFGIAHLLDVLAGKPGERISKFGHDRLSVFGIGKAEPLPVWQAVARKLETMEALVRDPEHGGLQLGPAARDILKGDVPISIRTPPTRAEKREAKRGTGGSSRSVTTADVAEADMALFEALRALRRQLAADAGLPPYVIFHDSTLRAMAATRPTDATALARIPGVGSAKLGLYGDAFLAVIRGR